MERGHFIHVVFRFIQGSGEGIAMARQLIGSSGNLPATCPARRICSQWWLQAPNFTKREIILDIPLIDVRRPVRPDIGSDHSALGAEIDPGPLLRIASTR
jgi:hypothetical protein